MKSLSNAPIDLPLQSEQGDLLKSRLSELLLQNKTKETLLSHLQKQISDLQHSNMQLQLQVEKQQKQWDQLKKQQEEQKSQDEEDMAQMKDWIQNVQKYNGVSQSTLDALLTIEFQGGENQICLACYSELTVGTMCTYLPCAHLYHQECIRNHLKINKFCLACQEPVTP